MHTASEISGLADTYAVKAMSPRGIGILDKCSTQAIFEALALRWTISVDEERLRRLRHRLVARERPPDERMAVRLALFKAA
jgi:hypothetical protein